MRDVDIIIVAPESLDYPNFRKFLHNIRYDFNEIIYVFTKDSSRFNYSNFIKTDLPFVKFIHSENKNNRDWRDVATNNGIDNSNANKILFIEPDFKINKNVLINMNLNNDVVSYYDSALRIWPSFLMVKKELLKKTDRNFSAGQFDQIVKLDGVNFKGTMIKNKITEKNVLVDHFGKFTSDLLNLTDDFCFLNESNIEFHHYAGITHNFSLCRNNTLQYLHNPLIFLDYLNESLKCGVQLDDSYKNECVKYIELIKNHYL